MFNPIAFRILLIIFISLALIANSKHDRILLNIVYLICIIINTVLLTTLLL